MSVRSALNTVACLLVLAACDGPAKDKAGAGPPATESTPASSQGKAANAEPPAAEPTPTPAPVPLPAEEITFTLEDGVTVYADWYELKHAENRPVILLFHQAGWNAGEYVPIAPRLQKLGYQVLAVDQRSGGARGGRRNRTVDHAGASTKFLPAYADLEAAVGYAESSGLRTVVWGSSYSAALVFKLAANNKSVEAVLAFSPGEYVGKEGTVAEWAKGVQQPIFVTSAPGKEVAATAAILAASPSPAKTHHRAVKGVHGSSILRTDKNAAGNEAVWAAVEKFLGELDLIED